MQAETGTNQIMKLSFESNFLHFCPMKAVIRKVLRHLVTFTFDIKRLQKTM